MTYFNEFGQARLGWRSPSSGGGGGSTIDADAQAFITAASITDTTQKSAINTLVTQLKTYGIWTKLKAVYPFVGGTASSHKFNLKDPRDLDAAFRITFNGGWTHSSNGALPNGTNAFAETFLAPQATLSQNSTHISYYSRTDNNSGFDIGARYPNTNPSMAYLAIRAGGNTISRLNNIGVEGNVANSDGRGFYMLSRTTSSEYASFKNTAKTTISQSSQSIPAQSITLGAYYEGAWYYGSKESAFASIGDGLTDTEAANFYTAVQTFQTTLGRQVGVPIVADSDAQAFLNAAVITDTTQASAINTLVTSLKSANIWTKMKAIYPFVGGTASSHKWNLKDPRDLDAAYRLVFNGGWTHSSTGALPNGTTAYADTKLNPSVLSNNNTSLSYYSRTNISALSCDIGVTAPSNTSYIPLIALYSRDDLNRFAVRMYNYSSGSDLVSSNTDSRGLFIGSRTNQSTLNAYINNVKVGSTNYTNFDNITTINKPIYIGAVNLDGSSTQFSTRESAFTSIGDGLTDAEATAFYNAVQAYQTALNRQV